MSRKTGKLLTDIRKYGTFELWSLGVFSLTLFKALW